MGIQHASIVQFLCSHIIFRSHAASTFGDVIVTELARLRILADARGETVRPGAVQLFVESYNRTSFATTVNGLSPTPMRGYRQIAFD